MTTEDIIGCKKVIARIGRDETRLPINPEKRADTPFDGQRHRGVWLSSRYRTRCEIERMAAALDWMCRQPGGAEIVGLVRSVWCNSKNGDAYVVALENSAAAHAEAVADLFELAFFAIKGGHNDICVGEGGESWVERELAFRDGEWIMPPDCDDEPAGDPEQPR